MSMGPALAPTLPAWPGRGLGVGGEPATHSSAGARARRGGCSDRGWRPRPRRPSRPPSPSGRSPRRPCSRAPSWGGGTAQVSGHLASSSRDFPHMARSPHLSCGQRLSQHSGQNLGVALHPLLSSHARSFNQVSFCLVSKRQPSLQPPRAPVSTQVRPCPSSAHSPPPGPARPALSPPHAHGPPLFLQHARHGPAPGPLHWLFLPPLITTRSQDQCHRLQEVLPDLLPQQGLCRWCPSCPWPLVWTTCCVTNLAGIAPGSTRIEAQASSGSQILAFHKASTW